MVNSVATRQVAAQSVTTTAKSNASSTAKDEGRSKATGAASANCPPASKTATDTTSLKSSGSVVAGSKDTSQDTASTAKSASSNTTGKAGNADNAGNAVAKSAYGGTATSAGTTTSQGKQQDTSGNAGVAKLYRGAAGVFEGASGVFKNMASQDAQRANIYTGFSNVFHGFSTLFNNMADQIAPAASVPVSGTKVTGGAYGTTPGGSADNGGAVTDSNGNVLSSPDVNRNIDFHTTPIDQRTELGLNDQDRAIDHLWGRQIISKGFQDGSVYKNVLDDVNNQSYKAAEHQLVQQLVAKEIGLDPSQASTVTSQTLERNKDKINGKALDSAFFDLMQRLSPDEQINTDKWLNAPAHAWDGKPINQIDDIANLQKQTGLSEFQQAALRLWGHEPLLNGGKIDGSVLAYTIGNANALDNQGIGANGKTGGGATSIDGIARGLLASDFASDGVRNGDTLKSAFGKTLDSIYLGKEAPTLQSIQAEAEQTAQANGRTPEQIKNDVKQGMVQALADSAKMVKDHPIISTMAVGSVAAATAVCPFLGAMGAGAAGIMAGQKMMGK